MKVSQIADAFYEACEKPGGHEAFVNEPNLWWGAEIFNHPNPKWRALFCRNVVWREWAEKLWPGWAQGQPPPPQQPLPPIQPRPATPPPQAAVPPPQPPQYAFQAPPPQPAAPSRPSQAIPGRPMVWCKWGCTPCRPAKPGEFRPGRPWDSCCRECASAGRARIQLAPDGHSAECETRWQQHHAQAL